MILLEARTRPQASLGHHPTDRVHLAPNILPDNGEMSGKAAKRWLISGIVQGVGFRYFVQDKAASLDLVGWTRNLSDGRVEVYAVGPASRLSDLAAALHIGPRAAHVRTVEERDENVQNLSGFSIR
ncbi:MAG: acylphosphatase [Acidobacteriaceae bacterium]|nr:acylphosphatase [Acidobacteriaceae bacterium]MBV8571737.1 acylphosphatase [Acidobacteriaceae bacterium]